MEFDKKLLFRRRVFLFIALIFCLAGAIYSGGYKFISAGTNEPETSPIAVETTTEQTDDEETNSPALEILEQLPIKNRASHKGYSRAEFLQNGAWGKWRDCDTRQRILARDLDNLTYKSDNCTVLTGVLEQDPYTGKRIEFTRGAGSTAVQIDHVVALSNAWETGAQLLDFNTRNQFANDDLNLLAVDGPANQQKSDSDAANWLPSFEPFRCQYVARQISVKFKYHLWVTLSEHDAIYKTLETCPDQKAYL